MVGLFSAVYSSSFIQAIRSLYPRDKTIAPVNRPINPDNMNPPITPRKITNIGTGAPFPRRIGFKILSEAPARSRYTVQSEADNVELAENKYAITGIMTTIGGNCNIARTITISAHIPAYGTPANRNPMPTKIA